MIVVDASVLVEYLLGRDGAVALIDAETTATTGVHAPELIDLEALNALRRMVRRGAIGAPSADAVVEDLGQLRLIRHSHDPLRRRIWELRHELSAYDAAYLALAEIFPQPRLLTADGGLAASARRALGATAVGELAG